MERIAVGMQKFAGSGVLFNGMFGDVGFRTELRGQSRSNSENFAGGIVDGYTLEMFALAKPIDDALQTFLGKLGAIEQRLNIIL
jgi:hypothetical protein